jgi:hypothetical protein
LRLDTPLALPNNRAMKRQSFLVVGGLILIAVVAYFVVKAKSDPPAVYVFNFDHALLANPDQFAADLNNAHPRWQRKLHFDPVRHDVAHKYTDPALPEVAQKKSIPLSGTGQHVTQRVGLDNDNDYAKILKDIGGQ